MTELKCSIDLTRLPISIEKYRGKSKIQNDNVQHKIPPTHLAPTEHDLFKNQGKH